MSTHSTDDAHPDDPSTVDVEAWYMDDVDGDQRSEHRTSPNEPVPFTKVSQLRVLYWKLDVGPDGSYEEHPRMTAIRKARGYNYIEVDTLSPASVPGYDQKIKGMYEEHIHTYEEIRWVLDGSGYFDVRDREDRWIRIAAKKGDLLIIPEGIYHRFTPDAHDHIKVLRIFVDGPLATRLARPQDQHASRISYLEALQELTATA